MGFNCLKATKPSVLCLLSAMALIGADSQPTPNVEVKETSHKIEKPLRKIEIEKFLLRMMSRIINFQI